VRLICKSQQATIDNSHMFKKYYSLVSEIFMHHLSLCGLDKLSHKRTCSIYEISEDLCSQALKSSIQKSWMFMLVFSCIGLNWLYDN
jgi:hypothetical protein